MTPRPGLTRRALAPGLGAIAIPVLGVVGFLILVVGGSFAIMTLMPPAEIVAPPNAVYLANTAPSSVALSAVVSPAVPPSAGWPAPVPDPAPTTPDPPAADVASVPARLSPIPPPVVVQTPAPQRRVVAPPRPAPPPRPPPREANAAPPPAEPPVHRQTPRAPPAVQSANTRNVLTPGEIRRIRLSLRLTAEQAPYWPPVEAVLTEIGAQQMALAQAGRNTADAFSGTTFRIYSAARPLIGLLREDQKAQIRNRARAMGLESVASYL